MIEPFGFGIDLTLAQNLGSHVGNEFGGGGRTPLVMDHLELVTLLGEAQHGVREVVPPHGMNPAGPQDQVITAR